MGQGASTPHSTGREGAGAGDRNSVQQQGNNGSQGGSPEDGERNEPDQLAARERRRRRMRSHLEHFTRLGSRLMPSSSSSSTPTSSPASARITRNFTLRRRRLSNSRSPSPSVGSSRVTNNSPRRRTMPPISNPIPLSGLDEGGDWQMPDAPATTTTPPRRPQSSESSAPATPSRRSRMSRVRNSLPSIPQSWMSDFSRSSSRPSSRRVSQTYRPNALSTLLNGFSSAMEADGSSANLGGDAASTDGTDGSPAPLRLPLAGTAGLLEGLENPGRQLAGEDQAAMLSRLLSVAAAATAASLVGNAEQAITEAQDVSGESGEDGSFESFLRALQNGRLASALRNGGNEMGGGAPTEGQAENGLMPLNFFRMFRFGSQPPANSNEENATESSNTPGRNEGGNTSAGNSTGESGEGEGDGNGESNARMVPVIIVGIRSVTPREGGANGDNRQPTPFFDALANLPMPSIGAGRRPRRTSTGGLSAPPENESPSTTPRTSTPFPPASNHLPSQRSSPLFSNATSTENTPPGPHPPPSTPADPGLSTYPSSSFHGNSDEPPAVEEGSVTVDASSTSTVRGETSRRRLPRRMSSPDGALPFSLPPLRPAEASRAQRGPSERVAGAAGGVGATGSSEPTGGATATAAGTGPRTGRAPGPGGINEGARSWIIYVLGGSYPENHPILTTPSLFTDTPTYEDMTLLSTMLGPAKPPVAEQEDIDSAGGVFTVGGDDVPEDFHPSSTDRCLVCLSDYEAGELARQLGKCRHVYHKECIDQWLRTGRNSCPLCRTQGVEGKEKPPSEETGPAETGTSGAASQTVDTSPLAISSEPNSELTQG